MKLQPLNFQTPISSQGYSGVANPPFYGPNLINTMQDPQRPRRASTQALGVVTTPERRNSFEAAQVFKATTRFVVVDS